MPLLSCDLNGQPHCSGSEEDHQTHRQKSSEKSWKRENMFYRENVLMIRLLSDKACVSLCSVCGSLGVGWGLQVGTAAWADRMPGFQSLTRPTNNEKVLLCPLYHWAIQERRRKAWQKQMQGREAPNDPDIACNTFHCSYSRWQTIDYKLGFDIFLL